MMKRFFRLFKDYRELEQKLEREEAFAASQGRYIEALEGRDKERLVFIGVLEKQNRERLARIGQLEEKSRDMLSAIRDMRERLAGLRPNHKEET